MITEDYVSFETAKLLKEKGFDYVSFYCYEEKGINDILFVILSAPLSNSDLDNTIESHKCYSAPTLQMAMKWLREVHNIHPNIVVDDFDTVAFYRVEGIFKSGSNRHWFDFEPNDNSEGLYNTYEKACEAAIKYCLENLI